MKQFKFELLDKDVLVKNLCGEHTSVVINDFVTAMLRFQKVPVFVVDKQNIMKILYPWTSGTLKDFIDTYLNKESSCKYFLLCGECPETPDQLVELWNKAVKEDRGFITVVNLRERIFRIEEPKKEIKKPSSFYIKRIDNGEVTFEKTSNKPEDFIMLLLDYIDTCYGPEVKIVFDFLSHFKI